MASSAAVTPSEASTTNSDRVRLFDRLNHLIPDERGKGVGLGALDASGIYKAHMAASPVEPPVNAIPRRPGQLLDERPARPGKPIEQSRLPHIRAADDRYKRRGFLEFSHGCVSVTETVAGCT